MLKIQPAEILFITSYPPRVCGIATYSQDLIKALTNKFGASFTISVCALESGKASYNYSREVSYILDTSLPNAFSDTARDINANTRISMVVIQHEFGFFKAQEHAFQLFLSALRKPVIVVFHTVLPRPDAQLLQLVQKTVAASQEIIVMTNHASHILVSEYLIPETKITVIAHGTHLVPHLDKKTLKHNRGLEAKMVLCTFGLLSSGKSIETTLLALPQIINDIPDVVFLVIGKTHPEVVKNEGEKYREMLVALVDKLGISKHVRFINEYLELPELLEYLQLTDIYLFTTNDPNQAVSGTFVYAMSCGCPIISTPIPHSKELLTDNTGIIIDFLDSNQLAKGVRLLLNDESLRNSMRINTLQKIISIAWEHSAVSHVNLFSKTLSGQLNQTYILPEIKLDHLKRMTTQFGILQFSKINQPDRASGYTLDDNARALVVMVQHYELTKDSRDLVFISVYLAFMQFCMQPTGSFLNYVAIDEQFTAQNQEVNLDDSNGRAVWALGFLISRKSVLPHELVDAALQLMNQFLPQALTIHSTRALAFIIKGLYFYHQVFESAHIRTLMVRLTNRLVQMYLHESSEKWKWFESYLTYANSILPEALLCASLVTGDEQYKKIASESMGFLMSKIFHGNGIEVISSKGRFKRGDVPRKFGEQPIDVAYTMIALAKFYEAFGDKHYYDKMLVSFEWFLGKNRLNQIVYNPCTGGCYDGLEEFNVNLNQGAESMVSYLMARLTLETYQGKTSKSSHPHDGTGLLISLVKSIATLNNLSVPTSLKL